MEEKLLLQVVGQIMVYDPGSKQWIPAGCPPIGCLSTVRIIEQQQLCQQSRQLLNSNFRIHGQKLNDLKEVVLDSVITREVQISRVNGTFIQWHDLQTLWGLDFSRGQHEADNFMLTFVEILNILRRYQKDQPQADPVLVPQGHRSPYEHHSSFIQQNIDPNLLAPPQMPSNQSILISQQILPIDERKKQLHIQQPSLINHLSSRVCLPQSLQEQPNYPSTSINFQRQLPILPLRNNNITETSIVSSANFHSNSVRPRATAIERQLHPQQQRQYADYTNVNQFDDVIRQNTNDNNNQGRGSFTQRQPLRTLPLVANNSVVVAQTVESNRKLQQQLNYQNKLKNTSKRKLPIVTGKGVLKLRDTSVGPRDSAFMQTMQENSIQNTRTTVDPVRRRNKSSVESPNVRVNIKDRAYSDDYDHNYCVENDYDLDQSDEFGGNYDNSCEMSIENEKFDYDTRDVYSDQLSSNDFDAENVADEQTEESVKGDEDDLYEEQEFEFVANDDDDDVVGDFGNNMTRIIETSCNNENDSHSILGNNIRKSTVISNSNNDDINFNSQDDIMCNPEDDNEDCFYDAEDDLYMNKEQDLLHNKEQTAPSLAMSSETKRQLPTKLFPLGNELLNNNNITVKFPPRIDEVVEEEEDEIEDDEVDDDEVEFADDEQYRDINNEDDQERRATNHAHAIDGHSKSMLNDIHKQRTIVDYFDETEEFMYEDLANPIEQNSSKIEQTNVSIVQQQQRPQKHSSSIATTTTADENNNQTSSGSTNNMTSSSAGNNTTTSNNLTLSMETSEPMRVDSFNVSPSLTTPHQITSDQNDIKGQKQRNPALGLHEHEQVQYEKGSMNILGANNATLIANEQQSKLFQEKDIEMLLKEKISQYIAEKEEQELKQENGFNEQQAQDLNLFESSQELMNQDQPEPGQNQEQAYNLFSIQHEQEAQQLDPIKQLNNGLAIAHSHELIDQEHLMERDGRFSDYNNNENNLQDSNEIMLVRGNKNQGLLIDGQIPTDVMDGGCDDDDDQYPMVNHEARQEFSDEQEDFERHLELEDEQRKLQEEMEAQYMHNREFSAENDSAEAYARETQDNPIIGDEYDDGKLIDERELAEIEAERENDQLQELDNNQQKDLNSKECEYEESDRRGHIINEDETDLASDLPRARIRWISAVNKIVNRANEVSNLSKHDHAIDCVCKIYRHKE